MDTKQVLFAAHNKVQVDAGAQFLLAESTRAYYLMTQFPQFSGRLVPLLRHSTIKYCQQAVGELSSRVIVDDERVEQFISALALRGRVVIDVDVEVLNDVGDVMRVMPHLGGLCK